MENINLFSNFAEMLHKDFTFYEGMKDTPKFRFQLNQNERYFERLQKRMEEMVKSINIVIDQGQHFMSSLYNLTVSLNRLWLDLQIDEAKEKIAFETYNILSDSLSQIVYLQKSLVEHAYPLLRAGFESFLKREMEKLADVKIHFDSLSTSLSDALSKKAAINKNKTQELQDAENSLTAIGTCFSHTGLDYVAQINIAHALKSPAILETLWAFIKEHGNFFTRGANFFVEQQEYMIGDALASMRASYKQIERKMQDRHTFVPKEIFQFPTGIPIDPECIMEGYLFKRSTNAFKTWNRRWFMIKEDKLIIIFWLYSHKTSDGEPEIPTIMEENLKLCLVRPAPSSIERACCFELVTPIKNHLLQADTETLCTAWIRALQRTIQHLHEDENGTYKYSRKSFVDNININESDIATTSSSIDGANDSNTQNMNILNDANNSNPSTSNLKNAEIAKQNMKSFLKDLLNVPGNDKCADCACECPKWTSLNLGIIICIECSGVHRSFGVQFSKVRSLTMDTLEIEQKNILLQLGNNFINSIFLGNLPKTESHDAFYGINRHSSRETREKWITDKYINKIFVKSLASNKPHTRSYSSLLPISSANSLANTNSVKMRSSGVILDELNIGKSRDNEKLFVNELECRISQNSFGSDSNLMQSASKAALACRESLISLGENNFMEDIKCGNIGKIFKWIVQKNIGLNDGITFEGSLFSTLLHAATENNQPTLVEFLLLNGAKINNVDGMKNTPLHLASDKGHTIIVYQLLKRNAEKSLKNIELKTPLDIAVERCHADIVTLLRLHEMKEEFNDDQNSTMDETVESFIGDLAAKQYLQEARTSENKEIQS